MQVCISHRRIECIPLFIEQTEGAGHIEFNEILKKSSCVIIDNDVGAKCPNSRENKQFTPNELSMDE